MIEDIYNEPEEISVRGNMDRYWQSWQELSMYPESQAARQAVVTRGESLAESIQQRFKSMSGVGTLINGDIEATVRQANSLTRQIASINEQIVKSEAVGDNPNDLYDRRDLLVENLSKIANITTDNRDSDEFMVHLDGHILVQGKVSRDFGLESITDGTGYTRVTWGDTGEKAEISGGSLGALLELRDEDVRSELQSLNTMAMNFADLVNDVHKNAVGANNVSGIDFFVQQPFVTSVAGNYDRDGDGVDDHSYIFRFTGSNSLNPQEKLGLEGEMTISAKSGTVNVPYHATDTIEDVIARINDSDGEVKAYLDRNSHLVLKATASADSENPDFVIRHVEDSGMFLTGYSGVLASSGADGAYDFARADAVQSLRDSAEFSVAPVTNPAAYIAVNDDIQKDVLSVAAAYPVRGGAMVGDGRAAVEIASIRNTYVMIGKDRTFDDYFANSVTNVGLKGEQAEQNYLSQNAIMNDLRSLRDSISGVNIDEELADIIKFQHGYNAAAKFVSVMDSLLDTVINRLGV